MKGFYINENGTYQNGRLYFDEILGINHVRRFIEFSAVDEYATKTHIAEAKADAKADLILEYESDLNFEEKNREKREKRLR